MCTKKTFVFIFVFSNFLVYYYYLQPHQNTTLSPSSTPSVSPCPPPYYCLCPACNNTTTAESSVPQPLSEVVITVSALTKPKRHYKLYPGHEVFLLVTQALSEVFTRLGISHEIVGNFNYSDTTSIYITNTIHHMELQLPKNYIGWNLEQLTTDRNFDPLLFERYRGAIELWDYSLENIKIHESHGYKVLHVPYAYAYCMSSFKYMYDPTIQRDLDAYFLGWMNERRWQIVQKLPNRDKVKLEGFYYNEDEYGKLARRSKIGLNLHYYSGRTILEVHRILPMIANNVLVLTQRSDDSWLDKMFEPIVEYFDENNFLEKWNRTLEMSEEVYREKTEKNLKYLQKEYSLLTWFLKSKSMVLRDLW